MRNVLIAAILILFQFNTAYAKPDEPIDPLPEWATKECVQTIQRIVQHEVGSMDEEAWRFVAEQAVYDVVSMGCDRLTQWRWKIGNYPLKKVSVGVRIAVWKVALAYPHFRYGKCQFIGYPGDIAVWKSRGYRLSADYRHSIGGLTVIGVNCKL
jgi:hypothetical protein